MNIRVASVALLVVCVVVASPQALLPFLPWSARVQVAHARIIDPWPSRPKLSYLLLSQNPRLVAETQGLVRSLNLSPQELIALTWLALPEEARIKAAVAKLKSRDHSRPPSDLEVRAHNAEAQSIIQDADAGVRKVLGVRYPVFRTWIQGWWERELAWAETKNKRQQSIPLLAPRSQVQRNPHARFTIRRGGSTQVIELAVNKTIDLRAQFDFSEPASADRTAKARTLNDTACYPWASNYVPNPGTPDWQLSLPDKYVKFANRRWPIPDAYAPYYNNPDYSVMLCYPTTACTVSPNVIVYDVGPWNEDDNYWDNERNPTGNPRRLFSDLQICRDEAWFAFYYGYNNGMNQFGDTVLNPAGIDLTLAVKQYIGMQGNDVLMMFTRDWSGKVLP